MSQKEFSNIYKSLGPSYFYLKILGLFPASFVGKRTNGKLKTRILDKIYFLILCFIWLTTFIYGIIRKLEVEERNDISVLILQMWNGSNYIGNFSFLITIIYQYIIFEQVLEFFSILHEFDSKVTFVIFCKSF